MPAASRSDVSSSLGLALASVPRTVSHFVLIALFTSFLVALTADNFAISTAHLPARTDGSGSLSPGTASFASSFSSQDTEQIPENHESAANSVDDPRLQEILTNLYTHMQSYQHSPSASLTSSDPNSPSQDHLIAERVKEFLKNMEQTNKQENLKMNFAPNVKKNGKTMNNEEMSKSATASGESTAGHYQPLGESASGAGKLKLDTYSTLTATEKRTDEVRDESQVPSNSYLASLGPSVQRKVLSTEPKTAGPVGGPSVPMSNGHGHPDNSIYELLASIDSRVQKLQDSLVYYRNAPAPKPPSTTLNPIFSNYLSLIKAQVLNIESTIEAKFSNLEHKFSNIEIEDGIWKKTINWKLEEMASKLSQNENKLSFSNEQIMNKMDLFERNFQIVTNDFFSKFLLVNEKLNKIELSLQTKWNDLEVKLRNSFTSDGYRPLLQKVPTLFKPDIAESAQVEHTFKETTLPQQPEQPTKGTAHIATAGEQPVVAKKPVQEQLKEGTVVSKLNWSKPSVMKPANVTISPDRLKFAQRFLKLMNIKTNQTTGTRKQFNGTSLLDSLMTNPNTQSATVGPSTLMNDAPQMEQAVMVNTSAANMARPTERQEMNSTAKGEKQSQLASSNYRLALASTPPQPQVDSKSTTQAGVNNRNLDTVEGQGINYSELLANRSAGSEQKSKPEAAEAAAATANANLISCEHLRSVLTSIPKESQQESKFYTLCNQMMEGNGTSPLQLALITGAELYREVSPPPESREAMLEKRELNEETVVDQVKEAAAAAAATAAAAAPERPSQLEETLNQLNEIKADKLEELDSKLQFFSTKIIKIVQEMWLSSQASENYLKESLVVANKTKNMMQEEFSKLQLAIKPVHQLANLAEEIREPIINRLQELTTALNNSMEVILNTQAGFINSCRFMRDEDIHLFEVLDYFINETQLQRNLHQTQIAQFNRSFEFLLVKLDAVNRKTIEGVRSETLKVLDIVKSELHHQVNNIASGHRAQSLLASAGGSGDMTRTMGGDSPSECFITKREFATFCIDDGKMFGAAMGELGADGHHPGASAKGLPPDLEIFANGTRAVGGIEINNGNEN